MKVATVEVSALKICTSTKFILLVMSVISIFHIVTDTADAWTAQD